MTGGELIRELRADRDSGQLLATRSSSCGKCTQSAHCGASLLTREVVAGSLPEAVAPAWEARYPAAHLLRLCALIFPLLALALPGGALLAQAVFPAAGDAAAAAGCLAGLAVGAACLRLYDAALGRRDILSRLVIVPSGHPSGSNV